MVPRSWFRVARAALVFLALVSMVLTSSLAWAASGSTGSPTIQTLPDGRVIVTLEFKDMGQATWALQNVIKMSALGVFHGFPDGTFQPDKPITRLEAVVTAVRLMGLEDEAKAQSTATLQLKDANVIAKQDAWAVGYVAVALQKGLFDSTFNELQPDKEASRLWVSTLLVRALGLQDQALKAMTSTLPFKDASAVPAGSVGYVAVAVQKGILTGYPDGTFQPNKPVTRAEMATLLARSDNELPDTGKKVEGKVTAVAADSITVQRDEGKPVTVPVTNATKVVFDETTGPFAAIRTGDSVEIVLDGSGNALVISVDAKTQKYKGTVLAVAAASTTATGTVTGTTYGTGGTVTGTTYSTTGTGGTVSSQTYGAATAGVLALKLKDGSTVELQLPADAKITLGEDQPATVADLTAGVKVEVRALGTLALAVQIHQPEGDQGDKKDKEAKDKESKDKEIDVKGTIVALTADSITVDSRDGGQVTYKLAADVQVRQGDQDLTLADLKVGATVTLKGKGGVVTKIKLKNKDSEGGD